MADCLARLFRRLGMDRAIAYSLLARAWQLLAGPVTLLLIARSLSSEEQGFYYTFTSLLALQVFFELGSAQVVLQFASHEKVHLAWRPDGSLEGPAKPMARLRSLAQLAARYYGLIAALFVAVLLPVGMCFFSAAGSEAAGVAWQLPWVLVMVATGGLLFLSPVFALLEGCGKVQEVAAFRLAQGCACSLVAWSALWLGAGLFVAGAYALCNLLFALGWIGWRHRALLRALLAGREDGADRIDWWREVWPFQWRIAVSWLSGYFAFHLFNPLLFALAGPREAGRMGMSLAIASAILTAAFAWINTKAPRFGALVARRDFHGLDRLFFPTLGLAFSIYAALAALVGATGAVLHHLQHPLADRLLAPLPLALLLGATGINVIVFSLAAYLRAHKEEPFLKLSILTGGAVGLTSYTGAQAWGATGMMLGYFLVNLTVGLVGGSMIFFAKRREWHKEAPHGPDDRDPHLQPQQHVAGESRTTPAAADA